MIPRFPLPRSWTCLAARQDGRIGAWLWLASVVLWPLGILLPALETSKLIFFDANHSILGFGLGLFGNGDYLLAAIVMLFSILFPAAKLFFLARAYFSRTHSISDREIYWLEVLGKWSMMDVLVIALIVFSAKGSVLGTAFAGPGTFLFAGSVLLAMLASGALARAHRAQKASQ